MKKILTLLVILAMVITAAPAVLGDYPTDDCAWDDANCIDGITTIATMTGQSGGGGGGGGENSPPIIKVKWEYDLDVEIMLDECDECDPCTGDYWYHDACCCIPGLQVKPILGGDVTVGYYAIVTDLEGVSTVDNVYADIWHPDGQFKYQIELMPVGFEDSTYDKSIALAEWAHVTDHHYDVLKFFDESIYNVSEIFEELDQEEAYLYYAEAQINYCQPGGFYYVGVRALDNYDAWSDYLYNAFWYIPTSGVEIDFTAVNYGNVAEDFEKWAGGDENMGTSDKPTVRNIGNTPVELYVWQDDMDFGMTSGDWNVEFDARMTADGDIVYYEPFEEDAGYSGVRIPGVLDLCTLEKLDFSILVHKGLAGWQYSGLMRLCAYIHMDTFVWDTPSQFVQNAPGGVPEIYEGPIYPGPWYP